jgi:dihydropteroate synthase
MFTLNCKGKLLSLEQPVVMGIINVTPDSFYAGSRQQHLDAILAKAGQFLQEGALILDIGGQSTRPGAAAIDEEEELRRVIAPIEALHQAFPGVILSIDTYSARVAREAVAAGASMVNDISAGSLDNALLKTVAELRVPYVLMHMQGTPQTMQERPSYQNLLTDILDFFIARLHVLRELGIRDIVVDPGFGFGKTIAQNFELLRGLSAFRVLDVPLLAGLSRKSTIYKTLGVTVDASLNGTTVLNTIALLQGASILRVHDVKEAVEAIQLVQACQPISVQ